MKEEPPDPFLIRVIEAVGLAGRDLPRFWIGQPATDHVRAWITAHGLTEDEVVVEVAKSRTKNADPPDGPKALDPWMAQAGAAKQSAGTIKARRSPRILRELDQGHEPVHGTQHDQQHPAG